MTSELTEHYQYEEHSINISHVNENHSSDVSDIEVAMLDYQKKQEDNGNWEKKKIKPIKMLKEAVEEVRNNFYFKRLIQRSVKMKRLFQAVRNNDLETVKRILEANPELINCVATPPPKKDNGQSLLQVANKVGCYEIAHYLIDKGIDVNYMEPDYGLPMTQCFTCPVLIDAVRFLLSGVLSWRKYADERMKLVLHLLEKGADPNRTDNRKRNSWDWAILTYLDTMPKIEDVEQRELFAALANELFDALYQYNADILNIDRVRNELKKDYEGYSILLENLILNRDYSYGVAPDRLERWDKFWLPIIPLIKPFYVKNNPNYEDNT